jgi:ATP-dependent DNA ligase
MQLPVVPPISPMLGRLARELPEGDYLYEPKWDGFRSLLFRDGDEVDLRSRNERPLGRYFPELVEAARALPARRVVLDGEILVIGDERFDFAALMSRLHPAASRVELLSRTAPATLVVFDILALEDEDLRDAPFAERRLRLEDALAGIEPPLHVTPATSDPEVAREWLRGTGGGIDGVMAKPRDMRYEPGARTMLKVKHERTVDCVVAGFRVYADEPVLSSLLLGLYDDAGRLEHVGVVSQLSAQRRAEIARELAPRIVELEGHPWEHGFLTAGGPMGRLKGAAGRWEPGMVRDWIPVAPQLVCEVAYDHADGARFRHPARFRRWRPDRDPASCHVDQLATEATRPGEVLA